MKFHGKREKTKECGRGETNVNNQGETIGSFGVKYKNEKVIFTGFPCL